MTATAYITDFATLADWTNSGMVVAGGEVKASVDNSTLGKITRTYETSAAGSLARMSSDFLVDTSMTSNTYVSVSLLDSSSTFGLCIYIKQGVGIVCSSYNGTPGYDQTTTLLAWASLTNGGRYHTEWTVNPASSVASYSLYDPSGSLVTRASVSANTPGWFDVTRLVVESNSNKTTISRLAIDPSIAGSAITGKYFSNTVKFTFYLTAANVPVTIATPGTGVSPVDLYIPGGGNLNELATYTHGSGQTPIFSEMPTYATGGPVMAAFLREGKMLLVPSIPDGLGGTESWGNDFGAASVAASIEYARDLIGDPNAPQHYISYSMGTLTAARLIGYDGQTNVQSWYILRGVCDLAWMEQNSGFASAIDTAWGVSHQGSLGAAQTTFARGNPIGLLGSNQSVFEDVAAIFMEYSTTGDTTVSQANNCVAFDALLTTKSIAHRNSIKAFATHTENSSAGDAMAHLAQISSAAALSAGDGSVTDIATAMRDSILNRVLAGNHDTTGTLGKLVQFLDALISSRAAPSDEMALESGIIQDIAEAVADETDIATALLAIAAIKAKSDQLTFTTANKVDATADVSLSQDNIDDIAEGVADAIGGGGTPAQVDNSEIIRQRVFKLGTRKDGVVVAFPDCIMVVGDKYPIWIDTSAYNSRFLEDVDDATSGDAGLSIVSTGMNQLLVVVWLQATVAGSYTVTVAAHPRAADSIICQLNVTAVEAS